MVSFALFNDSSEASFEDDGEGDEEDEDEDGEEEDEDAEEDTWDDEDIPCAKHPAP